MKILFVTDMHGCKWKYDLLVNVAQDFKADVVKKGMTKAMQTLCLYLVLVFFAAQFVAYFQWSNLGVIFAIKGADLLKASGLGIIPLMIMFIILSASINMLMGSASAKCALMAPSLPPWCPIRLPFSSSGQPC